MAKAARISAFVEHELKNSAMTVQKCSGLFEMLLINVRNEYKKFHADRDPKITNLEISPDNQNNSSADSSYLSDATFIQGFTRLKKHHELPFSTTQEIRDNNTSSFTNVVFPRQHILKTSYFVSNSSSRETFHQIQRHHKIWWMKYGTNPGKYSISDQKQEGSCKFVNIRSNVGDSVLDVERLKFFSLKDCIDEKEILSKFLCRVPNRKKEVLPDVIESVVDFQVASLALLMDAVHLSDNYVAFHRRTAPYQIALLVREPNKDLIDLARYIELLVTETNKSIVIINEAEGKVNSREELQDQLQKYDDVGIPYTIILDETALESGLFKLRNRNTTLSETVHLSDVTSYLIKIFNAD